jgi:hypothetical protein
MKQLSLLFFAAGLVAAAPTYQITALASIPGATGCIANDINIHGQSTGACGRFPVIWSPTGAVTVIGGMFSAAGLSINDNGYVVGFNSTGRGFYFDGVTAVPVGPNAPSNPFAINNSNVIVGDGEAGPWQSVAGAAHTLLADLGVGGHAAGAFAINDLGQIAGFAGVLDQFGNQTLELRRCGCDRHRNARAYSIQGSRNQ